MKNHRSETPPYWAQRWLHWYCPDNLLEEIEGDLLETFEYNAKEKGLRVARLRYTVDCIRFFNPTTFKKAKTLGNSPSYTLQNHLAMFNNYFKIAWRNLWRSKSQSLINLMGLSVGLTGGLLIALFVLDEWKFDRFHPAVDQTFRITSHRVSDGQRIATASTSPAIGLTLQKDFPEVTQSLRLFKVRQKMLFRKGDKHFLEQEGFFAEESIFELFHLPLEKGDPATALQEPNSVVLSPALAQKYFGTANPLGQTISINKQEVSVTGVLAPLSPHFHLDFDFLFSFEDLLSQVSKERIGSWVWQDFYSYIKLSPAASPAQLASKLPAFVENYAHPQTKALGFSYYLDLQPLTAIHLHSAGLRNDIIVVGNYRYVIGLALVGLFLVLIACINFINLTTAKAIRRAKEVGIRKAAGARRNQLAMQFISEAVLIVSLSMLIACHLTRLLLPLLNNFSGKLLFFPLYTNPLLILALLSLTVLTGIVAGSYPAFILSGFRPAEALKSAKLRLDGHVTWLRKGLITTQFALSILLIISVLIIFRQLNFLQQQDLGFHKEQLVHFPLKSKMFNNLELVKEKFSSVAGVTAASVGFGIPGDIIAGDNIIVPGVDRKTLPARLFTIDHDYLQTMGMELVAGRDFSTSIATDASTAFIVNETAVHTLGLADSPAEAIDKPLEWEMWNEQDSIKRGRVIGVVKDFHYNSMHEEVQTTVLHIYPGAYWKVMLRLDKEEINETLATIEKTWDNFETGYPIDYQFVDESFGAMYKEEQKLSSLLWIFTLLAIFIACIGAFGLATYAIAQREKEIGIRKVLGASVVGIVGLLSKDFLQLVLLALLVASPIAWYLMNGWLADFAYRVDIHWWIFALAGTIAFLIAFLTVSVQSIRAALANPIKALRSE